MIAVTRPGAGTARALATLVRAGRPARAVLWFVLDVLACLGSMLQPAFWAVLALGVAAGLGQAFVALGDPVFGGFVIGSLAVCAVAGVLVWAEHRHHWWTPREQSARPRAGGAR